MAKPIQLKKADDGSLVVYNRGKWRPVDSPWAKRIPGLAEAITSWKKENATPEITEEDIIGGHVGSDGELLSSSPNYQTPEWTQEDQEAYDATKPVTGGGKPFVKKEFKTFTAKPVTDKKDSEPVAHPNWTLGPDEILAEDAGPRHKWFSTGMWKGKKVVSPPSGYVKGEGNVWTYKETEPTDSGQTFGYDYQTTDPSKENYVHPSWINDWEKSDLATGPAISPTMTMMLKGGEPGWKVPDAWKIPFKKESIHSGGSGNVFTSFIQSVASTTKTLTDPDTLVQTVSTHLEGAVGAADTLKEEVLDTTETFVEGVVDTYQDSTVDQFMEDPVETMDDAYQGSAIDKIMEDPANVLLDTAVDTIETVLEKGEEVKDVVLEKGEEAKDYLSEKGEETKDYLAEKGEQVKDASVDFLEDVYETGKDIVEVITDPFGTAEDIIAGVQENKDVLAEKWDTAKGNLETNIKNISSNVGGALTEILTGLNEWSQNLVKGMTPPDGTPTGPGAEDLGFSAAMAGQGGDPQLATLRRRFKKSRKRGKAQLRKGGGLAIPYESGIQIPT